MGCSGLDSVVYLSLLSLVAGYSIPPENQHNDLHSLHMIKEYQSKAATQIEDISSGNYVAGSLTGREGEMIDNNILPSAQIPRDSNIVALPVTTDPTSVKKDLDDSGILMDAGRESELDDQSRYAFKESGKKLAYSDGVYHSDKSSVVPRKGVLEDAPSKIVGRKGVDNLNSTLSLDEDDLREIKEPLAIKKEGFVLGTSSASTVNIKDTSSSLRISTTTTSTTNALGVTRPSGGVNDIPKPPTKSATTPVPSLHPIPVEGGSSKPTVSRPATPAAVVKHAKPVVAVDSVSNKAFNSTPVIVGISIGVVVILTVSLLAYKKLQDVWSRRHYDRMDFLIDGMYDL